VSCSDWIHAFQTNRAAPDFWIGVGDDHSSNGDFYSFMSYNNLLRAVCGRYTQLVHRDPTLQAISSPALSPRRPT
jgi:hypothetical protein